MNKACTSALLGVLVLSAVRPCLADTLHDLAARLQTDMEQRESWVTHAGFPPNYRVDETAKVLLIDLDGAQLPRLQEEALLDGLVASATSDVQKAAIKIVRTQIAHDR